MAGAGLAQRLRESTASLHRQAERSRFMAALLAGRAGHHAYLQLLHNLLPIYAALEPLLLQHRHHGWLAPLWTPEMARLPALACDIAELQQPGQPALGPPQAASLAYADRLNQLKQRLARQPAAAPGGQPVPETELAVARLLAHAYVRCLGDLSGGQLLRRVVTQHLGLSGTRGTAFYDFGSAAQASALQQAWRQGLAALPADGAMADAAVQEANWSFEQHLRLFEALDAFIPAR